MHDAFHFAYRLLAVFFVRHWVFGLLNLALTLLLGLGLLRLIGFVGLIRQSSVTYIRLKRVILLWALAKGVFHLLLGDAHGVHGALVAWGLQLPDLRETLFLAQQTSHSLWHPTRLTFHVSTLLTGGAVFLLARRAWRLRRSGRALEAAVRWSGVPPTPQLQASFLRAAAIVGLPAHRPLPCLTLVPLAQPTPLLLGIRQPRILLSPRLADALSPAEMEMVLRHELAHFRRRDHWWRWLQVWLEDVGRPNVVSGYVGAWAVDQEETLCDQIAVRSPQDALVLARALETARRVAEEMASSVPPTGKKNSDQKDLIEPTVPTHAAGTTNQKATASPALPADLPDYVIPSLLGPHWSRTWNPSRFSQRLAALLSLAEERRAENDEREKVRQSGRPLQTLSHFVLRLPQIFLTSLLCLLLLAVLCLKFRLMFNLHGLG